MDAAAAAAPASRAGCWRVRAFAIVLLALAVLFAVLYRIENSREDHSYNSGATPPVNVHITAGQTVRDLDSGRPEGADRPDRQLGAAELQLHRRSTAARPSRSTRRGSTTSTRTTHAVGTFIAPVTGLVHIECRALPSTFIDDADNVSGDPAGAVPAAVHDLPDRRGHAGPVGAVPAQRRPPRRRVPTSAESGVGQRARRREEYGHLLAPPTDRLSERPLSYC